MKKEGCIKGFSPQDTRRITDVLHRVLRHLQPSEFTLVGGLAIRYHLLTQKKAYPKRQFNDIDIIVKTPKSLTPSLMQDFLICHFHEKEFLLALVDPLTKIKIDVFDSKITPTHTIPVPFGKTTLHIISSEDQLIKTVFDIQRISSNAHVDPKQFFDARQLLMITDRKKVSSLWESHAFEGKPHKFSDALTQEESIAMSHPEWIQEKPFRKKKPYHCTRCTYNTKFKITPMEDIYKILGYVE